MLLVICFAFVKLSVILSTVNGLPSLYPYGPNEGDAELSNQHEVLALSKSMLLFSKMRNRIHVSSKGVLSIDSAVNVANITLSGKITLLAVYNQDFDTSLGGKIYYRESLEESILSRANRDVARTHVTNFTATQSVVVTYVDVTTLLATNETNTFQVVLASDGYDTYAIMTYHRLEILSGLVGYSELNCDWAEFASREISVKLSSTSNIEQTGVHVFPLTTKNCSSVELYPYGVTHGDKEMQRGDNYAEMFFFEKPMLLFSNTSNHIFVSTNGLLSVNKSVTSSVSFPYHHTVLAPYHLNFNSLKGGAIYYRESYDNELLKRADADIAKYSSENFIATQAFVVSYIDVVPENLTSDKHTFQVILASNGSVTYGIFNYQKLSQSYAVTGASEQLCSWMTFSKSYGDDPSKSNYLVDQSNIGIQGRFVFELTSQDCETREKWETDLPSDLEITRLGYDFVEIKWSHYPSAADMWIRTHSYFYVVVVTSYGDWKSRTYQLNSEYARIEDLKQKRVYQIEVYTQRSQLLFLPGLPVTLPRVSPVIFEPVYDVKITQVKSQGLFQWVTPASLLQDYVGAKIVIKHTYEEFGEPVTTTVSSSVCDKQYVFNGTIGSVHQIEATPVIDDVSGPSENDTHTFYDDSKPSDNTEQTIIIIVSSVAAVLVAVLLAVFAWYQKVQNKRMNAFLMTRGSTKLDPDKTILEQCNNLVYDMKFEFSRKKLILVRVLGEGAFGQVWMATAEGIEHFKPRNTRRTRSIFKKLIPKTNKKTVVAVKALKGNATENEYKDLANELKLLIHLGEHRNVVNLLGACTRSNTLLVILEYCAKGALLNHLRLNRDDFEPIWQRQDDGNLSLYDLTWISVQISDGMDFLESKQCVHRDLAARNILLTDNMDVKISDFGLARDTDNKSFYLKESDGLLPIKWMAPEAINEQKYTSKSDSWSFGVLLWEIYSLGSSPYPGIKNAAIMDYLKAGKRMGKPKFCPTDVYEIMNQCWSAPPDMRPSFIDIRNKLDRILITNEKSFFGGQSMARVYNIGPSSGKVSDGVGEGLSPFAFMESDETVTHMNVIENFDTRKAPNVNDDSAGNNYTRVQRDNIPFEDQDYVALQPAENEDYFAFEVEHKEHEEGDMKKEDDRKEYIEKTKEPEDEGYAEELEGEEMFQEPADGEYVVFKSNGNEKIEDSDEGPVKPKIENDKSTKKEFSKTTTDDRCLIETNNEVEKPEDNTRELNMIIQNSEDTLQSSNDNIKNSMNNNRDTGSSSECDSDVKKLNEINQDPHGKVSDNKPDSQNPDSTIHSISNTTETAKSPVN
ncbi:uncharacterized protein LOC130630320 [Hydractinia symbiolongicarpus]|uniref:uncharacterized protein LOC130630320 n=1 Tax=Hydractinia symbiolongicarpus TaxID=13093 RepID=UPI00254A5C9F|nr:uncharacterized protein LOC130630320 [Hydractinia symbiolongicarpus]